MRPTNTLHGRLLAGALSLAAVLMPSICLSASGVLEQTWTIDGNTLDTTAKTFGTAGLPSWGYPNIPIPSNAARFSESQNANGTFRVMANYWNPDTVGGKVKSEYMRISVDDQTGAFTILRSADSYYTNGNPQQACTPKSTDPQDPCRWAPSLKYPYAPIHAPAAYPSIYNGCHYGQCTAKGNYSNKEGARPITIPGAPYPVRIDRLASFPIQWTIDTSKRKSTAVFNASFDIWFNRDMPRNANDYPQPQKLEQNNGLELMIWVNNQGYKKGGVAKGAIIQPSGNLKYSDVSIQGVSGKWDVWVTNKKPLSNIDKPDITWDVVSLVRLSGTDNFQVDAKWLIDYISTLSCSSGPCLDGKFSKAEPWWMTSSQAGFETWADSENLSSVYFAAEPSGRPSEVLAQGVWTDSSASKIQVVDSKKPYKFVASGCDVFTEGKDGVDFLIYDATTYNTVHQWSEPTGVDLDVVGTHSTAVTGYLSGWEGRKLIVRATKYCGSTKSSHVASTAFYLK